jgi:hypothetical protein
MEKEIVEARLLVSIKAGPQGKLFTPMVYYAPNIPREVLEEHSLNRGTVLVRFKQAVPQPSVPVVAEVKQESVAVVEEKSKEVIIPEVEKAVEIPKVSSKSSPIKRRK